MQSHRDKEAVLVKSSEKQQKTLEEVLHHLAALENQEEEREMRIALQEDLIQQLQDELVIVQGKVCCCHERPVAGGHTLEGPSTQNEEEEEGLEYASKCSYMTPPTALLELEDIITQDALRFSTPPVEEQEGVRECCQTRVVEYLALGARAPGTSGNIVGTLKALDQFASDISTRHSLITFRM